MANQKKRTAWSVQDVVSGKANSSGQGAKFKSGYSGPKKSSSTVMDRYGRDSTRESEGVGSRRQDKTGINSRSSYSSNGGSSAGRRFSGYQGPSRQDERWSNVNSSVNSQGNAHIAMGSGILDYAWIVYSAVLGLCLLLAIILYSVNGSSRKGYTYPSYIFSFNGVLNEIYDDYVDGGLGSRYRYAQMNHEGEDENVDKDSLLGENTNSSTLPNTTTGATMALDTGGTYGDYPSATSHSELVEQVQKALEANDFGFIGMKLAYEDESSGSLIGYPQSVVEHFTNYMSENTGKREVFISEISNSDEYSGKNGAAYIIKLPILKFTINMGYSNTNVSVSGFSDQKMEAGQSAVVSPLLPCMYTITVTTDEGSQSSEVECDMAEGNLQINIGVTN